MNGQDFVVVVLMTDDMKWQRDQQETCQGMYNCESAEINFSKVIFRNNEIYGDI